jgi:hypothetical protein
VDFEYMDDDVSHGELEVLGKLEVLRESILFDARGAKSVDAINTMKSPHPKAPWEVKVSHHERGIVVFLQCFVVEGSIEGLKVNGDPVLVDDPVQQNEIQATDEVNSHRSRHAQMDLLE